MSFGLMDFSDNSVAQLGMTTAEAYERVYLEIRDDPFRLCQLLNFTPTWQQAEVLQAYQRGYDQLVVSSGQGAGKTSIDVVIALSRMLRGTGALVVLTAPSMKQCQDVFMRTAKEMLSKADPLLRGLFTFTMRKIFVGKRGRDEGNEPHWGLIAVTATDPVNAQGYHNWALTFIVDEASGIERPFTDQIKGTLAQNRDALLVMTGNPNTVDSEMYDAMNRDRADWSCHVFNCEESPIVDQDKVARLKRAWGYDSNAYRVRVRGLFPKKDPDCVMSMEDLVECTKVNPGEAVTWGGDHRQQGIDLARFGGDDSVISPVSGNALLFQEVFANQEPSAVVARAFVIERELHWKNCRYVPDADGLGQGVMDVFHSAHKDTVEFHTSGVPYDTNMYANKMTEAWFQLAGLVRERRCYIPAEDAELLSQLANRRYMVRRTDGKLILETKEDYKKRTERGSPDRADSCVMGFWRPPEEGFFQY